MPNKVLTTIVFIGVLIILVGYSIQAALTSTPAPTKLPETIVLDGVFSDPTTPVLQPLAQVHQPKRADITQKPSDIIYFTVVSPPSQELVLAGPPEKLKDINQ